MFGGTAPAEAPAAKVAEYDYKFKLVLIGERDVGKTFLLRRYIAGDAAERPTTTLGTDYQSKTIVLKNGARLRAQIWDTAGQERYKALTTGFFRKAEGALLVFDLTRRDTFLKCSAWLEALERYADADCQIFLVGNKLDLVQADPSLREISTDEAQKFAVDKDVEYVETSAETSHNVNSSFEDLMAYVYTAQVEANDDSTGDTKASYDGQGSKGGFFSLSRTQTKAGSISLTGGADAGGPTQTCGGCAG